MFALIYSLALQCILLLSYVSRCQHFQDVVLRMLKYHDPLGGDGSFRAVVVARHRHHTTAD